MQVEDGLTAALADVHHDAIVLETHAPCGLGYEIEHPLRLVRREFGHLPETRHMALRDDEQVGVGPGIDVANGDEPFRLRHMIAFHDESAEETVVRQRESPPRKPLHREPRRTGPPAHRRATASSR